MANPVVSLLKTPWHIASEYYHRMPQRDFDWSFGDASVRRRADPYVAALRRDGIVMLPAFFQGEMLEGLRAGFERVIANMPHRCTPDALQNTDFMTEDEVFMRAALDDLMLEIVAGYYRKPFAIGNMAADRILPTPVSRAHAKWHHDTRGRQLHMMILLHDVSANGQRMSYLARSHDRYYTHFRAHAESACFEEDMQRALLEQPGLADRIVEVTGAAGTVAFFDANGLHTVNRNEVAKRDTLRFYYVSYRHFKKFSFRRAHLASLPPQKRKVITFNPKVDWVD